MIMCVAYHLYLSHCSFALVSYCWRAAKSPNEYIFACEWCTQCWRAAHIRYTTSSTIQWKLMFAPPSNAFAHEFERSEREKWEETSAEAIANYKVVMVHTILPKIHWVWNTLWISIQLSLDAATTDQCVLLSENVYYCLARTMYFG